MAAVGRSVVHDIGLHILSFVKGRETAGVVALLNKEWSAFTEEKTLWEFYLGQEFRYFGQTDNPKKIYQERFCEQSWNLPQTRILSLSCRVEKSFNRRSNSFGNVKVVYVIVG